jgi:hypothetical protein
MSIPALVAELTANNIQLIARLVGANTQPDRN